ncbi:hypothetical protein [Fibrella forsythiae]|uniref:DUF998 domain-containing protein n=1 Tax=Fibrella forsythiae TaxID=2817061 RepID=A0ABS3JLH9_9BACT|nr:hypothetical protein [Fibrella forsythiae]MBO0949757.1 hypothetical protein [Fibrella forsythiae]
MEQTSKYLRRASFAYVLAGTGLLAFGFQFWFLGAVETKAQGRLLAPFIFLADDPFIPTEQGGWIGLISKASMFVGAFSLWKIGEPTGLGKKRSLLFIPMAGAVAYVLGQWLPLPFAPMGAFLNGIGMLLVGIASLRASIWTGWKRYAPLIVGSFPFVFMFPILFISGARPAELIGIWGFPWLLLGLAAWQRAQEVSSKLPTTKPL